MGVRKAMEAVLAEANKKEGPIYTYGPLIHNKQVLDLLGSKGVRIVHEVDGLKKGTILIRAHGIPPQQRKILRASKLKIVDATCPKVARVQAIIRYHTNKGYVPVIVGDKDHAEVIGLVGYGNGQARVVSNLSEVTTLPEKGKLLVVAQTTQNENSFQEIVGAIQERSPDTLVFNTICDATSDRQNEVRLLAGQVDGLTVVGGYDSGNTCRLVEIAKAEGIPTFHIESEKELNYEGLSTMEVIGVTAGASTPNWMINNVVKEIENIRSRKETFLNRWVRKGFKFFLLSNFLVAIGAFSLSYAAALLSGRKADFIHPFLAFFYVYAMRVLNRFLDRGASTYNDPERASFYKRYKVFLILTSIIAILGALIISFTLGFSIFLMVAGLCLLGITYSVPIVPTGLRHLWRYSKIKDVPGSKTFSEASETGKSARPSMAVCS